jgi:glycosyltransferase involved in cell wall biosynthesis
VVYDCVYPSSIGGAEFWLRELSESLSTSGWEVTYLTSRIGSEAPSPITGVDVIPVSSTRGLYDNEGKRRTLPALTFGMGVFWHLVRHRRRYDSVVVASFPYFSVLGARTALIGRSGSLTVLWLEAWTKGFWTQYAGEVTGRVGYLVQWLTIKASPHAIAISPHVSKRLSQSGLSSSCDTIPGLLPSRLPDSVARVGSNSTKIVVYAGRHILDKGVDLLPAIFESVHVADPEVRFVVASGGPMQDQIRLDMDQRGLASVVTFTGFIPQEELDGLISRADCVVLPSRREGFGILAASASAFGTPVVVGDFPENASADQVVSGVNGFIAQPPTPDQFAALVQQVLGEGPKLRRSSRAWFEREGSRMTMSASNDFVAERLLDFLTPRS